ncbi:MAG: GatB/YqeY domain-containing protein [Candidatus Pacebacteria bacterium]|nr:GatB/YqeY domain-containing protein [Candidatus Paceibacterota bacterium]
MNLKEKINSDLKDSMKSGDAKVRGVLRMLNSDIKNFEIEKKTEASDDDILGIVKRNVKKRKDSIEQYTKGDRKDLVEKENEELLVLEKYMPEQMSEDEVRRIVQKVIQEFGEVSPSDFGKIIGMSVKETKGMADGSVVSKIVKEELNK